MIDALDIGYAIKDRRKQLGLTQEQIAEASGVSKRCLWSLELGQNPGVQLDKLTAVLGALGLDLAIAPANNARDAAEGRINPVEDPGAPTETAHDNADAPIALPGQQKKAARNEPPRGNPASARDDGTGLNALAILTGAAR